MLKRFMLGSTRSIYQQQGRNFSFSWPCPRKLREIVKISAFSKENEETCSMIWNEYHHAKPHTVSTVLSGSQYGELMSKGKGAPMFI
jgi:ATP synthase F1 complex assembly factor 1